MLWRESTEEGETNGGTSVHIQIGDIAHNGVSPLPHRATLLLAVLSPVVYEQAFNELRTNQQLGYIVWGSARASSGVGHIQIDVQSSVVSPDEVQKRIDAFLHKQMPEFLQALDGEAWQDLVNGAIAKWTEQVGICIDLCFFFCFLSDK